MKSFQVIRTHISPYQSQDFQKHEETLISGLEGLHYQTLGNFKDLETILITNTHTQLRDIPKSVLDKTRLIIHPNSGYDHFSKDYDLWKNIPIIIGHQIRAQAVAEYSLGALFQGLLDLPQHITWHQERSWNRTLLKDTSVWIFGHGHIGSIIAQTLTTLGMKVSIIDPFKPGAFQDWKSSALPKPRVVIAACGLNEHTFKMFNEDFFTHMNDEILFINGARGKLVEESSLKNYLAKNPRSFAFLDVFENEPFGNEWLGHPQVWKTSHIAGVEKDLDQKILQFEEMVLKDFLNQPHLLFLEKYSQELLQNKWIQGVLV